MFVKNNIITLMSVDYTKKPIFRMVHFDNLEYLLRKGMCTSNHSLADPCYINIGDNGLIKQRHDFPVIIDPGGYLGDYVPFYFAGHSPMLFNIKTGFRGIQRRSQSEIVFVVCIIEGIIQNCPLWCFTDGHAKTRITRFYNSLSDLKNIDWETVKLQYWINCEDDFDRMRKKQAEFLIRNHVPVNCIAGVIVHTPQREAQVEEILERLNLTIPVMVDDNHKYFYP